MSERHDVFAGHDAGDSRFLLCGASAVTQRATGQDNRRQPRLHDQSAPNRFRDNHRFNTGAAKAAMRFGQADTEQTHFRHGGP